MPGGTCEKEGCLEPGEIGGLCVPHYNEHYNSRYRPDKFGSENPCKERQCVECGAWLSTNQKKDKCTSCLRKEANARWLEKEKAVTMEADHCKDCGKEIRRAFIGRCRKCFNLWHAGKTTGSETKTPEPETKDSKPEPEEPAVTKEPCQIDKKSPGEVTPDEPLGMSVRADYASGEAISVTVDFTRYPNIHKSLLKLAEEQFRTPANQLLFLLHDHLEGLEERAAEKEADSGH